MKKVLLSVLLLLSSYAMADSVSVGAGSTNNSNETKSQSFNIKYIHDLDRTIDVDILANNLRNTTTQILQTQYETGIRYKLLVNKNFIPYVRTSLGTLENSGKTSLNYVGLETGIIARPLANDLFVRADYTAMTSLNYDNFDMNLTRAWIGYDLTKQDSVSVRKDWMNGSISFNALYMFYTRKF
jgi:hypothetical protein